jgi:hypothetical protein
VLKLVGDEALKEPLWDRRFRPKRQGIDLNFIFFKP